MEFLKAILGDELFAKFAEKLNAYNGDEANKDKQIKLGEPFIQNIVIPAMNTLSGAVENASLKFQEAKTWVSEHRMAIELLVTVTFPTFTVPIMRLVDIRADKAVTSRSPVILCFLATMTIFICCAVAINIKIFRFRVTNVLLTVFVLGVLTQQKTLN